MARKKSGARKKKRSSAGGRGRAGKAGSAESGRRGRKKVSRKKSGKRGKKVFARKKTSQQKKTSHKKKTQKGTARRGPVRGRSEDDEFSMGHDFDEEREERSIPLPWEKSVDEDDFDDEEESLPRGRSAKRSTKKTTKKVATKPAAPLAKGSIAKTYPKLADAGLDRLLDKLDRARQPLFREWRSVIKAIKNEIAIDDDPHVFCTRKYNQMRITDLEALSIARAFRDDLRLKRRLPQVKERIAEELRRLKRDRRRQNFTCPLLEGDKCMVHQTAKPIGCLAWRADQGPSEAGWRAFNQRNHYNDRMINLDWDIAAIPIMLDKYIDGERLEPGAVKVNEGHRARSRRGDEVATSGAGRRGSARLSEREKKQYPIKGRDRKKKAAKKKLAKKKIVRKKSNRKRTQKRHR